MRVSNVPFDMINIEDEKIIERLITKKKLNYLSWFRITIIQFIQTKNMQVKELFGDVSRTKR